MIECMYVAATERGAGGGTLGVTEFLASGMIWAETLNQVPVPRQRSAVALGVFPLN